MASEYVLRIPLERHIINTRRPFAAVIEDIRDAVGSSEAGGGPHEPTSAACSGCSSTCRRWACAVP
ncbi:hypothetical protein ACIBQ1_40980 [Nonomuraea sp. NPDC050153]|uniref:hypothetical protein n=1 Tax=Nonomuraea sp. NPDC050153 TaxID=3364359 RepID=UPI0037B7D118